MLFIGMAIGCFMGMFTTILVTNISKNKGE